MPFRPPPAVRRSSRVPFSCPSRISAPSSSPFRRSAPHLQHRRHLHARFTRPSELPSGTQSNYPRLFHTLPGPLALRNTRKSGSGFFTAVLFFGIGIGTALVVSLIPRYHSSEEYNREAKTDTPSKSFDPSDYTDSFLVMAPNMPPGRPGTLTPEQEIKLRELWAATMKVFGVYEPPRSSSGDANTTAGAEAPSIAPSTATSDATSEKDASGKKEKKKSRLNVFKRKDKGEKNGDVSDSAPASGTSTPLEKDISAMSIADEDDKHGQTKAFKHAIANSSPDEIRDTFWSMVKYDHPDGLLLRFLRARKWDVEKALVMMISTMHWRSEDMHVDDDIIANGELHALQQSRSDDAKVRKEGEDFLAQLRIGKSFLHGVDKEGRPMCVVRVRLHRGGEQSEQAVERFTVYTIETARMFLRPPVDTATIVFDMTSFSMANMDYAPVKFMIKCFEANYPESLGTVLVYKAPWIFNAIWNIIRGWLDPVVAGKVHFVKTPEELEQFVEKSKILEELGGDEKWDYSYVEPVEGENDKMKDENAKAQLKDERQQIVNMYESEVLRWIHAGATATESETSAEALAARRKTRDGLAEQLTQNYWKLDPYVRARTLYERIGMLQEGGKVEFYPKAEPAPAPAAASAAPPMQETSPDDLD